MIKFPVDAPSIRLVGVSGVAKTTIDVKWIPRRMIDTNIMVIIVVTVLTITAGYHIAYRQGIFSRTNLFITVGTHEDLLKTPNPIWLVLVGIPDSNADYYIIGLPLVLENKSRHVPLRNVWIQLSFPRERVSPILKLKRFRIGQWTKVNFGDTKRKISPLDDRILIEYNVPLLRPQEKYCIVEPIVYNRSEIFVERKLSTEQLGTKENKENSCVIDIDLVGYHMPAENNRRVDRKFWLGALPSENIDFLGEAFAKVSKELTNREDPAYFYRFGAIAGRWVFAVPYLPLISWRPGLLLQETRFVKTGRLAEDPLLFGQNSGVQQAVFSGIFNLDRVIYVLSRKQPVDS